MGFGFFCMVGPESEGEGVSTWTWMTSGFMMADRIKPNPEPFLCSVLQIKSGSFQKS